MEVEKRALYNLLRMSWLNDPTTEADLWQREDYRSLPTEEIFFRLETLGISLSQLAFFSYSEEMESPEEFTELLLENSDAEPILQDQVYLLVFELWRRLLPERICLSIFCDELDYQIYLYDKGDSTSAEAIQDVLANLQMIMDENVDQGFSPAEVLDSVSAACANNLESFLYDYIAEQIDNENIAYAKELIEGFDKYFRGSKWFDLLSIRVLETLDSDEARQGLKKVVQKAVKEEDLAFNLEILSFIVQGGEKEEFNKMVRKTVVLLKTEEDFLDLLSICADYYRCLDEDQKENQIQEIIDTREIDSLTQKIDPFDKDIAKLLKILR